MPQSILLTDTIEPILKRRHPDGHYIIGQDCGIYWRLTDPPQAGAKCPDWFYVPGVPPTLDGKIRRSYVLWQEWKSPLILLEFVSGDGSEERDRTPTTGKFWVYENVFRPAYYGIYEVDPGRIEMYHLVENRFQRLPPNEQGRYPIAGMDVELGIWQGRYQNVELPWMRWWDAGGNLLLTGHELAKIEADRAALEAARAEQESARAEQESARAEQESARADYETNRADLLAAQLRALGVEPEA